MKKFIALIISGILLACSFPKLTFFPLAWFCLIPFLHFLIGRKTWRLVILGHILFFGPFFSIVLYWIPRVIYEYGELSWLISGVIFLLLVAAMSLLMFPISAITQLISRKSSQEIALLTIPATWTSCELLRNYVGAGGFPWASLGYSQVPFSWLLQVADLGGVYLISFLLVALNCVWIFWWRDIRGPAIVGISFFLLAVFYGAVRPASWELYQETGRRVSLIQPGVELLGSDEYFEQVYFRKLPEEYLRAAAGGVDWVFFPETPNPYSPDRDGYFKRFWSKVISNGKTGLIMNATGRLQGLDHYFNSAFVVDKKGRFIHRYNKRKLVPFGEYIPLGGIQLGFGGPLIQGGMDFSPGARSQKNPSMDGVPFGMLICYESIFPELSRKAVREGAQFLVNVTNDRWFGFSAAPFQHLQMAILRAVEQRKPLLRAANYGVSAWIDEMGVIRKRLDLFDTGHLEISFHPNSYRTVNSYLGDWSIFILILVTGIGAIVRIRIEKREGIAYERLS